MSLGISSSPSSSFGDSVTPPEDKCSTTPATSSGLGSHFDPLVKRKRNKPTLNCRACVERKTKCDRERPGCGACLRRGTDCQYQEGVASSGKGVKQLRNGTNASQVGVKVCGISLSIPNNAQPDKRLSRKAMRVGRNVLRAPSFGLLPSGSKRTCLFPSTPLTAVL